MDSIVALDISGSCTGMSHIVTDNSRIVAITTRALRPADGFNGTACGYSPHKRRAWTLAGDSFQSWVYPGEKLLSRTEKTRRDKEMRQAQRAYILEHLGNGLREALTEWAPTFILLERNAAFHGILTTKALAEYAGVAWGVARVFAPVEEWPVATIRACFPSARGVSSPKEEVQRVLEEIYAPWRQGPWTLDESDSLAVFHAWWTSGFRTKEEPAND